MIFLLKILALMVLSTYVQSKETTKVWKSIKLNEKMVYDCVEIYKQPSLNHPLLRNHKIQMKPSFPMTKSKNKVGSRRIRKTIECPNGTVPILRDTKEYVTNAQYQAKKHFNPLTLESHGTHFAGARLQMQDKGPYTAVASWISVHDLNISRDQLSYGHMYAGSRINNEDNFIQIGWMINQRLFGDNRPWSYGFWKGAHGGGCFNAVCPGFIQVSTFVPLSEALVQAPEGKRNLAQTIQVDAKGNWWITDILYKKEDIGIGYWPKELFNLLGTGVNTVGVGGAVESSPSGKSPPMGNGNLPTNDDMHSARVKKLTTLTSRDKLFQYPDESDLEKVLDNDKCYGVKKGKQHLLIFGGPGGDNCGI
ncbi:unnamed protein product [Cochlearia groenlandica]